MANDNFALGMGVVAGLGYLFTRMKDDKEEFREEEWSPRFYRKRKALKKARKQIHDAELVYRKYKGRKGPAISATSVKRGTRRRGNDGKMWVVRKSGKSQRWFKDAESFEAPIFWQQDLHSIGKGLMEDNRPYCEGKDRGDRGFCDYEFEYGSSSIEAECKKCGDLLYWGWSDDKGDEGGCEGGDKGFCTFDWNYGPDGVSTLCNVCFAEVSLDFPANRPIGEDPYPLDAESFDAEDEVWVFRGSGWIKDDVDWNKKWRRKIEDYYHNLDHALSAFLHEFLMRGGYSQINRPWGLESSMDNAEAKEWLISDRELNNNYAQSNMSFFGLREEENQVPNPLPVGRPLERMDLNTLTDLWVQINTERLSREYRRTGKLPEFEGEQNSHDWVEGRWSYSVAPYEMEFKDTESFEAEDTPRCYCKSEKGRKMVLIETEIEDDEYGDMYRGYSVREEEWKCPSCKKSKWIGPIFFAESFDAEDCSECKDGRMYATWVEFVCNNCPHTEGPLNQASQRSYDCSECKDGRMDATWVEYVCNNCPHTEFGSESFEAEGKICKDCGETYEDCDMFLNPDCERLEGVELSHEDKATRIYEGIQQNINNPETVRFYYELFYGEPPAEDYEGDMALDVIEAVEQNLGGEAFVDYMYGKMYNAESFEAEWDFGDDRESLRKGDEHSDFNNAWRWIFKTKRREWPKWGQKFYDKYEWTLDDPHWNPQLDAESFEAEDCNHDWAVSREEISIWEATNPPALLADATLSILNAWTVEEEWMNYDAELNVERLLPQKFT